MKGRMGRRWPVPILVGVGLIMVVMVVSASTATPGAVDFRWKRLSTTGWFGAYPEIETGDNGLVVAVWTEGPDDIEKHNGPLKLAWTSDARTSWTTVTLDSEKTYDAAVAVSGSTVHVIWSRPKNFVRYTTCTYTPSPVGFDCNPSDFVAATGDEALQVDIVVDGGGKPHAAWVETFDEGNKIYYSRKTGTVWSVKTVVTNSSDSEGPALAYANGFIHMAWTEWLELVHTDSQVRYCRRGASDDAWSQCRALASWETEDFRARNLSTTADEAGHVYVVWDMLSIEDKNPVTGQWSKRNFAIGYRHNDNDGALDDWKDVRTYPRGNEWASSLSDVTIFESGEGQSLKEYVHYVRPHVSLAMSGTNNYVPVLSWHSQVSTGGEEEMAPAAVLQSPPYQVFWTYATEPGSYLLSSGNDGYMYWASDVYTLSLDFCGEVQLFRDSATARLAAVGDLKEILAGESPGNHLHAVYHEETNGEFWGTLYNNTQERSCFGANLPVLMRKGSD
jgi:hypothetical protein